MSALPLRRGPHRRGAPVCRERRPARRDRPEVFHRPRAGTYDAGVAILIDPPRARGARPPVVAPGQRHQPRRAARLRPLGRHPRARVRGRPLRHPRGALRDGRRGRRAPRPRPATCSGPCRRAGCGCRSDVGTRASRACAASASSTAPRADVDLIRSDREADEARVFAAMAFVRDDAGDFAARPLRAPRRVGGPGWVARAGGVGARERGSRGPRGDRAGRRPRETLMPRGYERFHRRSSGGLWRGGPRPPAGVRGAGARPPARPRRRARRHLRPPVGDLGRARARVLRPVLVAAGEAVLSPRAG